MGFRLFKRTAKQVVFIETTIQKLYYINAHFFYELAIYTSSCTCSVTENETNNSALPLKVQCNK